MSEYAVAVDVAMDRLAVTHDYDPGDGPQDCVHTFRAGAFLLGAHWSLTAARTAMERHGVEEAGPFMQGMRHGLVVVDDAGPVFFETKVPEAEAAA